MGAFNEELVKAGVMLAGEGLHPSSKGVAGRVPGRRAHGDRRPVRRDQGAPRRLLGVAGEVDGRGDRVGRSGSRNPTGEQAEWSRSARCSRPTTSARSSRPSCASGRSGCAHRPEAPAALQPRPVAGRDVNAPIEAVWRIESARLIAGLARLVRDVGLAEDLAQEALVAALEQWPESGVPDNPGAWLMATAKHRGDRPPAARRMATSARPRSSAASSRVRGDGGRAGSRGRDRRPVRRRSAAADLHGLPSGALDRRAGGADPAPARRADDRGDRRAYLVSESAVAQRIVRAKRTLSAARVPFEVPERDELRERLGSVLEVVYLIFNEGYSATAGERWSGRADRGGAAARAHPGRAAPARAGGPRARRADGAAGVAHPGADRRRR